MVQTRLINLMMSSKHDGVTCDVCDLHNFSCRRYKCLICSDYDLCATCYERGASSERHRPEHAVQCILTKKDFDLAYAGENISPDQPPALTCPFCGRMGLTEVALQCHLASDHADAMQEVICPICTLIPLGDANYITDDLVAHMALEHRGRDLITFLTESGPRHALRQRTAGQQRSALGRGRRSSQINNVAYPHTPLPQTSMDNIVEMLSHYRDRSATPQLQQYQVQVQMARQLPNQTAKPPERANTSKMFSLQTQNLWPFHPPPPATTNDTTTDGNLLLQRHWDKKQNQQELEEQDLLNASRSDFVRNVLWNILSESSFPQPNI